MKVLILSANTGQGHNSCAQAIKEVYESHGVQCDICDALALISQNASEFIANWHTRIYRHIPGAFRWGYRFSENHPAVFREKSIANRVISAGAEKLFVYIARERYDIVICTHVFAALMLTVAMKKVAFPAKTCYVSTDYTCSPSTEESNVDLYFIPDESLKDDFAVGNITKEKMIASGIPVRQEFFKTKDKIKAKKRLGIDLSAAHLLVMCGSMGCGPIEKMTNRIIKNMTDKEEISIICGTNADLKKRLIKKHRGNRKVHVYGYVENTAFFMDSADLYLTKPGGISVTEAAVKGLPMIFVDAVAGCETYNANFFADRGGALMAGGEKDTAKACLKLLSDKKRLSEMSDALSTIIKGNPAEIIYDTLA